VAALSNVCRQDLVGTSPYVFLSFFFPSTAATSSQVSGFTTLRTQARGVRVHNASFLRQLLPLTRLDSRVERSTHASVKHLAVLSRYDACGPIWVSIQGGNAATNGARSMYSHTDATERLVECELSHTATWLRTTPLTPHELRRRTPADTGAGCSARHESGADDAAHPRPS
jgi:hypothetical protein